MSPIFVAACAASSGCTTSGATPRHEAMHMGALPATSVRALDRSETQLGAALGGRPALIALWATWCDACRDEVPALKKLDGWAKNRGAVVVGVAVGESIGQVSSYSTEHRLPYLVLVDEDFKLADTLGEKRVPTTLVVDRSGRIVFVGGALDDRALAALQRVLPSEAPVAAR